MGFGRLRFPSLTSPNQASFLRIRRTYDFGESHAQHQEDHNIFLICLYAIIPYATHTDDASSPVRIFLFSRTFSYSPSFPLANKKHSTYPNLPFRHN